METMIYDEREPLTPAEIRETLSKLAEISENIHKMVMLVNENVKNLNERLSALEFEKYYDQP